MSDLIAQGNEAQERWRRSLPRRETVVLGRASGVWSVPWDPHVSRRHVRLCFDGGRLEVVRLAEAQNPVFFRGEQADRFSLEPGEHFVIGGTTFTLSDQRVSITADAPRPLQEQSFSSEYLKQIQFRNPDHRIEVLSRLPRVISGAAGEDELCVRLVSMLLAGLPGAGTAAVVAVDVAIDVECDGKPDEPSAARRPVRVLHWDQRLVTGGDFLPSEQLIVKALDQRQSVLHIWADAAADSRPASAAARTGGSDLDWAFCVPVVDPAGNDCSSEVWGLYVAGRFNVPLPATPGTSDPRDVREDMKFAELIAATLSSLLQMRLLERRHANLSQFFSPVVLGTLAVEDPELVLAPRQTEVSVLFCDLRGFSRETERHADDLMGLLERVSRALGVMTHHILDSGGVVGDFQGDAAMGFWGWPLAEREGVARTCRAALGIREEFEAAAQDPASPLAGFHAGIGIATGQAVAGKIGTVDQVKVTVFGPVVNLASRLEGMTRLLHAPILMDETTARAIREQVPRHTARVRRLAVVRPYGLENPLEVAELLPPESCCPLLTDAHLADYESALDAFLAGRWSEALELLHRLPTEDRVTDFLTAHIVQHNRTPPPQWDGVIPLGSK